MLVHGPRQRHHAPMIATHAQPLANVAEHLRDDEIHVWWLDYQPSHGRNPLRRVLGSYLGWPADRVQLIDGEHGRPALVQRDGSRLDFNWSHSGEHALIAIARDVAPGIDLERQRRRPRALEIASRYFHVDEAAALARLPPEQRDAAFLQLWTAKEAVLKAIGRGLAFGLDRLSIARSVDQLVLQQLEGDHVDAWQLRPLPVAQTHVATLAWRGDARDIRFGTLASDD